MKRLLIIYTQLLVTVFFSIRSTAQLNSQDDYTALRALYLITDGDNWTNNTGWPNAATFTANTTVPSGTDMSSWHGIIGSSALQRVTSISLATNNLVGKLPTELGNLASLGYLRLSSNKLTGKIPVEITTLTNLNYLDFSFNSFEGSIATSFGNLTKLKYLSLGGNQLDGIIPATLGNLTNLEQLGLSNNQLTGTIPTELSNLTKLANLYLNDNQLTGSIEVFENLTNLEQLRLSYNQLNGSIPEKIGNLTNLTVLHLAGNQLSGKIPSELGNLTSLTILDLSNNKLEETIPATFANLANLTTFKVANNNLSGCYAPALKTGSSVLCNFTNAEIYDGNDFDAKWEEFCASNEGACSSLSIDEFGIENTITVYPNPAKDVIIIKGFNTTKATIYNSIGVKIKELNTNNNSFKIKELPMGVYIVQLTNRDRKKQVIKLLKN